MSYFVTKINLVVILIKLKNDFIFLGNFQFLLFNIGPRVRFINLI